MRKVADLIAALYAATVIALLALAFVWGRFGLPGKILAAAGLATLLLIFLMPDSLWQLLTADPQTEIARQNAVLQRLRAEYIASHDGITPQMLAGTEPLPKDWTERRLNELGQTWRREAYW